LRQNGVMYSGIAESRRKREEERTLRKIRFS